MTVMKNALILLGSIAVLSFTFSFTVPDNRILGRWNKIQKTPDGPLELVFVFRADSTYDGIVNGKAFINGNYFIKNDTISVSDNSCSIAYYGTYRLKYFAQDSLSFTAISDTCKERYEGAHGLRVKKMQKK